MNRLLIFSVIVIGMVALWLAPADAQTKKVPANLDVNKRIFEFCQKNIGKKIGNGDADELAKEAALAAGAVDRDNTPRPPKVNLQDGDYVWGKLLGPKDDVLPGDIMQFRDIEIKQQKGNVIETQKLPRHTAVIGRVVGRFHFIVLHQNYGDANTPAAVAQTVQLGEFNMNFRTKGEAWIYRPIAPAKEAPKDKDTKKP